MMVTIRRTTLLGIALIATLTACARVPGIYTYEANGGTQPVAAFDATAYAASAWTGKVLPAVRDRAVDVTVVAAAIEQDPAAAGERYGHRSGTGSPYAYLVKGSGTVTKIDRAAPTGPMTVAVPRAGGEPLTVTVATGPVIAGTALRDGAGIAFGDFTNQIEYADVARSLNEKAKSDVVAAVDLDAVTGRRVSFAGAFSTVGTIVVVPAELRVD